MINWQFRRAPDEVPTPVAIALADFCRRAAAPASPTEVRTALALLDASDDAQVRALADAAPPASPLGPLAVVDIVKGTSATEAARRQAWGVYVGVADALPPAPRAASVEFGRAPARTGPVSPKSTARPSKATPLTVAEKIAPKRRTPGGDRGRSSSEPTGEPPVASAPKRQLPAPRGRFVRIDGHAPTRQPPRS